MLDCGEEEKGKWRGDEREGSGEEGKAWIDGGRVDREIDLEMLRARSMMTRIV